MIAINHLVSTAKEMQFIITITIGEASTSTETTFFCHSGFKDILIEVDSEKLTEHIITYADQHLPGSQLFSANVIKCSLFAFKLPYIKQETCFYSKKSV